MKGDPSRTRCSHSIPGPLGLQLQAFLQTQSNCSSPRRPRTLTCCCCSLLVSSMALSSFFFFRISMTLAEGEGAGQAQIGGADSKGRTCQGAWLARTLSIPL